MRAGWADWSSERRYGATMRHLWSLLAGVVAAPLTWVMIAAGQSGSDRTISGWVEADSFNWANLLEPTVYLGIAGLLLGLLGTLRFSPAGPLAAGALLVTPYAGMFADPFAVRDAVPGNWKLFGDDLPLRLPLDNGTLLLVGVLLVMATFSIQRWRRWPVAAPNPAAGASGTGTSGTAAPETDDERTLTDWPPAAPDQPAPTLGHPDPTKPAVPLPRRDGGSPWSAPPRSMAKHGSSTG